MFVKSLLEGVGNNLKNLGHVATITQENNLPVLKVAKGNEVYTVSTKNYDVIIRSERFVSDITLDGNVTTVVNRLSKLLC